MSSDNSFQSKSKTDFGNEFSEVEFVRRVLLELGVFEENSEIDRIITKIKVDEFQEKMEKYYDPDMRPYFPLKK